MNKNLFHASLVANIILMFFVVAVLFAAKLEHEDAKTFERRWQGTDSSLESTKSILKEVREQNESYKESLKVYEDERNKRAPSFLVDQDGNIWRWNWEKRKWVFYKRD